MLYIFFLTIHLTFALMIFFLTIAFLTGAPFVPSNKGASASMIRLAKLKPGDNVYDLGSGDGRLIFAAARIVRKTVGLEINPFLVILSNIKRLFFPEREKVAFLLSNFWTTDIFDADVVFVYLLPWKMNALEKKLKTELKSGARIVSNSFIFRNLEMINKDELNHVYVFRI